MTKKSKKTINALAKLLYKMQGYEVDEGYDFSEAYHPQEKAMWEMAKMSRDFWRMVEGGKK